MRKKLIIAIVILSVLLAAAIGAVIFLESGRNGGGNGAGDNTEQQGSSLILETEGDDEFKTPEVTFSDDDSNQNDLPENTFEGQGGSSDGESATRDPNENALPEQDF